MTEDLKRRIREQNDRFRRRDPAIPGRVMLTQGVQALIEEKGDGSPAGLFAEIGQFDDFTTNNDPHGEHDFASMTYLGERLFWKIDLYDEAYAFGSEEPDNLTKTRRVLTVMLPNEY